MHASMPVLNYIQMVQSVIVVSWVPALSIVRKGTNVAAVELPSYEDFTGNYQFHDFISQNRI